MQVNSINNQNFNGIIIPSNVKTKLEQDIIKMMSHDTQKLADTSKLIFSIQKDKPNFNLRIVPKHDKLTPKTDADFDVFVEDISKHSQVAVQGDSLATRFINGLKQISRMG
ncbi:MAG: hypothetical protein K6A44_06075 [bacterium]|nr:hypothetical protein [bacterium]